MLAAVERFRTYLRACGLRMTGVRELIVKAALAQDGHFRVDDLWGDLRITGKPVAVSTVYRTVPHLMRAGLIAPVTVSSERGTYEVVFGRAEHDHLICVDCGLVVEFAEEGFALLSHSVAERHGFTLTGYVHELIGVCRACRERSPSPGMSA